MAKEPFLLVVRLEKDFIRNRLLPLKTVLSALISMGGYIIFYLADPVSFLQPR